VTAVPFYGLRSYSGDEREIGRAATIEEYASELVDRFSSITWNGPASLLVELGDVYAHRSLLGAPWRFGDVPRRASSWRNALVWHRSNREPAEWDRWGAQTASPAPRE
jgi:hypothetical protein